ncbi:MAG: hypothetical protein LAO21_03855 [Acidobacteriia bacterium]|nr:hypothetical protein [Terriglobia bacterium]
MPTGIAILGGAGVLVFGGMVAAGAAVYQAGAVRVSVDEKRPDGHHIHLIAPAAAIPIGIRFVPDRALRHASSEVRPWLPAIEVAVTELEKYRDFTLVEVEDGQDHVKIRKIGPSMVIDVDSTDATVHVSFPLRSAMSALRRIEALPKDSKNTIVDDRFSDEDD